MAHERLETGLLYNPTAAENIRDPYPMYRRFRERDPFHRSRLIGGFVLFRYADVLEVLRDPRFSSAVGSSRRASSTPTSRSRCRCCAWIRPTTRGCAAS
jgi:cytochrome P450